MKKCGVRKANSILSRALLPAVTVAFMILLTSEASASPLQTEMTDSLFTSFVHDFGAVSEGEVLEGIFEIPNPTERALRFGQVATSCDACLKVVLYDHLVAAHGDARLRVLLDTRGKSGEIEEVVRLIADGEMGPVFIVKVRAEVLPLFSLEPDRVVFDGVVYGDMAKSSIEVRTRPGAYGRSAPIARIVPSPLSRYA